MYKRNTIRLTTLAGLVLLTACAPTEPLEHQRRPDMDEVAKLLDCPVGRTPACIERLNQPYSCFCADRDALRDILEPEPH